MRCPMPILPQLTTLNPLRTSPKLKQFITHQILKICLLVLILSKNFTILEKEKNDLVRHIPSLVKLAHQGQLEETLTKKAYVDDTYKGHRVAEFNIKLTNNQYMNFHNVYLFFPVKIKKAPTMILILMQRSHWIKEIDIKTCGDDIPILPLTNAVEIYKYSDAMLKYETLETYQHHLSYTKKGLNYPSGKIDIAIEQQLMLLQVIERTITLTIELTNLLTNLKMNFIIEFF